MKGKAMTNMHPSRQAILDKITLPLDITKIMQEIYAWQDPLNIGWVDVPALLLKHTTKPVGRPRKDNTTEE